MSQHTIKRAGQVIVIVRYSVEEFEGEHCVYQHYADNSPGLYAGGFDLYCEYETPEEAREVCDKLNREIGANA